MRYVLEIASKQGEALLFAFGGLVTNNKVDVVPKSIVTEKKWRKSESASKLILSLKRRSVARLHPRRDHSTGGYRVRENNG